MGYSKTNRIQEKAGAWTDSAAEAMECGVQQARETVAANPATAVFTAFGVGMGVGVCLAMAIGGRTSGSLDYGFRDKLGQFLNDHVPWMNS